MEFLNEVILVSSSGLILGVPLNVITIITGSNEEMSSVYTHCFTTFSKLVSEVSTGRILCNLVKNMGGKSISIVYNKIKLFCKPQIFASFTIFGWSEKYRDAKIKYIFTIYKV